MDTADFLPVEFLETVLAVLRTHHIDAVASRIDKNQFVKLFRQGTLACNIFYFGKLIPMK